MNIISFKNCEIQIEGNVDKNLFKSCLGKKFLYKINNLNPFTKHNEKIIITIIPNKPCLIKEIYFDETLNNKIYNKTKLNSILGLTGYIWKKINLYDYFSQIKIELEAINSKSSFNIFPDFNLEFYI